jgi:YcxB-like protein
VEPLELTLAYESRDWAHFSRTVIRRNPRVFAFLALFGIFPLITGQGIVDAVSAEIIFVSFASAYMLIVQPFLQARYLQRAITAAGPQPTRMVLDDNGLHTDNNGLHGDVPWSGLGSFIETKRAIMIRIGKKGAFFLLPRRLLTEAEYVAARQWIEGRVLQGPDSISREREASPVRQ